MFKSKSLFVSFIIATLLVGCGSKPKFNAEYCDGLHQPKKSIVDSANANDPHAQLDMAEMYFVGYCGDKDIVKAKEWFLKSANQDYTPAQLTFGAAYLNADMDDVDQAIFWLNRVIEKKW